MRADESIDIARGIAHFNGMVTNVGLTNFSRLTTAFNAVVFVLLCFASVAQGEYLISDFDGTGFDWLCCGFRQDIASTEATLRSEDGWGIADVRTSGTDLSSMVDERFQVRVRMNEGNGAGELSLGLVDSNNNEAKWWFDVDSQGTAGGWSTLTASSAINAPSSGTGDWQNIDLTDITRFRVLGHWQHPDPFNMSIDRLAITSPSAYAGSEPDAVWRAVAAEQIDEFRKANLRVNVTDRLGQPLPDAKVDVRMQQHEFGFGSAVQAHRLRDLNPRSHEAYREKVDELFNVATVENNLKWPPWNGEWGSQYSQRGAERAVKWLNDRDIDVRGHALVWPGRSNVSTEAKSILDQQSLSAVQQSELRSLIEERIGDTAGRFAGQLSAWDVVNEPRTNHDLMDVLDEGDLAMVDWFQQARAADPQAVLYLNDYGILTSGGNTNTFNQREFLETAKFLVENGAPIGGIGFQSHFRESSLTGPEEVWAILDQFHELGLDMQVTEFDLDTIDESLQARYTEDFMTAVFAHPGMEDFVLWGFYEDAHWRPGAAMYRSDWSIKPNGEAYRDLVFDEWWTEESLQTDSAGQGDVRGFKGDYLVTVTHNGVERTVEANLTDGGLVVDVRLESFAANTGDFNGDGFADAIDIDLLLDAVDDPSPESRFDLNDDGVVDVADRDVLVIDVFGTIPGDADLDGQVQFSDFSSVANSYGGPGGWSDGDFDGDGIVRFIDFVILAENYGEVGAIAVPEPSGATVALLGMFLCGVVRQRTRRVELKSIVD